MVKPVKKTQKTATAVKPEVAKAAEKATGPTPRPETPGGRLPGYVPPPTVLTALVRRQREPNGGESVSMPKAVYHKLLEALFKPVFDERQYLERNADVNQGVKSGAIPSALSHFVTEGFWEKRLALKFPVDEAWYRSFYGDVAREIQFGRIRDGAQHFELFGFQEGRVPSKHYQVEVAEWHNLAKKRAKPK